MQSAAVGRTMLDAATDKVITDGRDTKKVAEAAKEFESLLLGTWLSAAENSFAKLPGTEDDEDSDPGREQFQSMAMQSLATSITEAGGIGIAKMIQKQLETPDANEKSFSLTQIRRP